MRPVYCATIVPGLAILNAPPLGYVGVAYSFAFKGFGGTLPYTWECLSSLPSGWSFNTSTATLSNSSIGSATPFDITIYLRDANFDYEVTQTFTVGIGALPLTLSGDLPDLAAGTAITPYTYTASGGAGGNSFAITIGALPTGLSINSSTGQVTGTPSAAGSYSWTVRVTDSHSNTTSLPDSNTVAATTLTGHYPNQIQGVAPSAFSYATSGGIGTPTFAITSGSLPTSVSLNTSTGALTGTPSVASSFSWTVSVTYSTSGGASLPDSCVVASALALTGSFGNIYDNGDAGSTAGSITISGGTSPYSLHGGTGVNSGTLPTGLSLSISGSTLSLTGTTSAYGSYTFTVRVDDSASGNVISASQTIIVGDPHWSNVQLLCHGDLNGGAGNGPGSAHDITGKSFGSNPTQTISGFSATTPVKFTGRSLNYSANSTGAISNGQIATVNNDTSFNFGSGDCTVECWVYYVANGNGFKGLIVRDDLGGTRSWLLALRDSTTTLGAPSFSMFVGSTASGAPASVALTANTWTHIAGVRDGNTVRLYVNGVQANSASISGSVNNAAGTTPLVIGMLWNGNIWSANSAFGGYLQDMRVTKGFCRYPSGTTFSVPTRLFQNGGV